MKMRNEWKIEEVVENLVSKSKCLDILDRTYDIEIFLY